MNNIQVITEFRHLIAKFKEHQKRFGIALVNHDYNDPVFEAIDKVVIEIKEKLAQYDVLQIDDLTLRNDLIAIRENKDFGYFLVLDILSKYGGTEENFTFAPDMPMDKWWTILQDEIISNVDPDTLFRRKMDVGALLVGKTMPKHLTGHLAMIKDCYTWGFGDAASIYCRTILEEGFREALKSKSEFKMPQQRRDLETWPFEWLLKHSRKNKYFYVEAIDRAYKIKENVNHIVHPTSGKRPSKRMSPLEILKGTFYVLEMLFR